MGLRACVCVYKCTTDWRIYGNSGTKCSSFFTIYLLSNTKCHICSVCLLFKNTPFQFSLATFVRCDVFVIVAVSVSVGDWISFVVECIHICMHVHWNTFFTWFHSLFLFVVLDWLYFDTVDSIRLFVSSFFFFLLIIKCFWLRFFPMHLNPPKMIFAEQEKSWLRQFVDFCFYLQMRNHFFHSLFRLSYAKNALHCLFNTMEIKKISISIRTFWQRDEYLLIENREKKSHHKNTVLNWLTGCLAGWIIIIINQYSFNFYCVYTHYTRRDRDI